MFIQEYSKMFIIIYFITYKKSYYRANFIFLLVCNVPHKIIGKQSLIFSYNLTKTVANAERR